MALMDQSQQVRAALVEMRRRRPPLPGAAAMAPAATAPALVPEDRRHVTRLRERCHARVSTWNDGRTGAAFDVVVEDISTGGVGLLHSGRLEIGRQYLLEIPRPHQTPLRALFTVVRCDQRDGGTFKLQLSPDEVLNVTADHAGHLAPGAASSADGLTSSPRRQRVRAVAVALALAVWTLAVIGQLI